MSYIQQVLNKRLGIQTTYEDRIKKQQEINREHEIKKEQEQPKPEIKEEIKPVEKLEDIKVKPQPKNARGAGRKRVNTAEMERKKKIIIEKLSKGNEEDINTIKEITENSTKKEIQDEIKASKKKLQLLNSAFHFTDE